MSRRLVVFLGGFDPRGARHYHRLFREECTRQAALSGHAVAVEPRMRTPDGHARWTLRRAPHRVGAVAAAEQRGVETCVEFFDWTDLVRQHWPRSTLAVLRQSFITYGLALRSWRWLRPLREAAPYTLLTFAYPLLFTLLWVLLAGSGAAAAVWGAQALGWAAAGRALVAAAVFAALLVAGWWLERQLHVSWLLRIFNFAAQEHGTFELLEPRLDALARRLDEELQAGRWDEVLLVGFSVGSVLGVRLADKLAAREAVRSGGQERVSLVTLGNCIPLFALMPHAAALRAALARLARAPGLYWADVSSPSDSVSVSFALCDVVGLSLREDAAAWQAATAPCNPRAMCSPRFHKLFRPRSYALIRRNKMRMHMQYLMAGELPGPYDYFEMVAGARTLRQYLQDQLIR